MQLVYLSNRPTILRDTLAHVVRYMPFITEAVILCPEAQMNEFARDIGIKVTVLSEDEIKKSDPNGKWGNKSFQNYQLRKSMMSLPALNEEFIMSDDDYRPLELIDITYFKEDGKYHSYYFYDLKKWQGKSTTYDECLKNTQLILSHFDFDALGFSSHQPQIIDKEVYLQATEFFEKADWNTSFCEWSIYFNFGLKRRQDLFHKPKAHHTMCWPPLPGLWAEYVTPSHYYFENYYPEHYTQGGLFENLKEWVEPDQQAANTLSKLALIEKVRTREIYPPPLGKWRKKSFIQSIKNHFMKTLFTIREEVGLSDRKRILELEQEIERLKSED